jgi:hypothetical protein
VRGISFVNLTIGITYTAPARRRGLRSRGSYIVNIPPLVPHSFQNLDDEVAELVVIFPTNVWEYDVLDYFPFADLPGEPAATPSAAGGE